MRTEKRHDVEGNTRKKVLVDPYTNLAKMSRKKDVLQKQAQFWFYENLVNERIEKTHDIKVFKKIQK